MILTTINRLNELLASLELSQPLPGLNIPADKPADLKEIVDSVDSISGLTPPYGFYIDILCLIYECFKWNRALHICEQRSIASARSAIASFNKDLNRKSRMLHDLNEKIQHNIGDHKLPQLQVEFRTLENSMQRTLKDKWLCQAYINKDLIMDLNKSIDGTM